MKTGIDSVEVARFTGASDRFIQRTLAPAEKDYYLSRGSKPQTLAGFFAAKEAFVKMLGVGIFAGVKLTDVVVSHEPSGKPVYILFDTAKVAFSEAGLTGIDLSVTHTATTATAICVAW